MILSIGEDQVEVDSQLNENKTLINWKIPKLKNMLSDRFLRGEICCNVTPKKKSLHINLSI
jgi:hypothetical protein